MKTRATIKKISSARNVSDDLVRTLTLEIYDPIGDLEPLMKKPLQVTIEPESQG